MRFNNYPSQILSDYAPWVLTLGIVAALTGCSANASDRHKEVAITAITPPASPQDATSFLLTSDELPSEAASQDMLVLNRAQWHSELLKQSAPETINPDNCKPLPDATALDADKARATWTIHDLSYSLSYVQAAQDLTKLKSSFTDCAHYQQHSNGNSSTVDTTITEKKVDVLPALYLSSINTTSPDNLSSADAAENKKPSAVMKFIQTIVLTKGKSTLQLEVTSANPFTDDQNELIEQILTRQLKKMPDN